MRNNLLLKGTQSVIHLPEDHYDDADLHCYGNEELPDLYDFDIYVKVTCNECRAEYHTEYDEQAMTIQGPQFCQFCGDENLDLEMYISDP